MKHTTSIVTLLLFVTCAAVAQKTPPKEGMVWAKDGSGVFGYKDTPIQPWSGYHVHDPDRPNPKRVEPAPPGQPPSDAIVLFDGSSLSKWKPSEWKVENGYVEVTEGHLITREEYGDCQLHVEFRTPNPPEGDTMNQGNSGVNLMGVFEIQIHEMYQIPLYPDGQSGAIYAQTPPLVDASRGPGDWQSFDIVFIAPQYEAGKLIRRPRVTVFYNGVLIHYDQEIYGGVAHRRLPRPFAKGKSTGPVHLGGHHNPVRFRNIWIRPL